jgi:hypothetical protein
MRKNEFYKVLTGCLTAYIWGIQYDGPDDNGIRHQKEDEQEWLQKIEYAGLSEYADPIYKSKFFCFEDQPPHYSSMAAELTHRNKKFQSDVLEPLIIMCKDHPKVKYRHALVYLLNEFAKKYSEDIINN